MMCIVSNTSTTKKSEKEDLQVCQNLCVQVVQKILLLRLLRRARVRDDAHHRTDSPLLRCIAGAGRGEGGHADQLCVLHSLSIMSRVASPQGDQEIREGLGGPARHWRSGHWLLHVAHRGVPERELRGGDPARGRVPYVCRVVGELRGQEISSGSCQAARQDQRQAQEDEILRLLLHLCLEDRSVLLLNAPVPPPDRTSYRANVQ